MTGGEEPGFLGIVGRMAVALEYFGSTLWGSCSSSLGLHASPLSSCTTGAACPAWAPCKKPNINAAEQEKKNDHRKMLPAAAFPA